MMRARVGENISTNAPPFRSPQFDSLLNPTIFSQAKNNNDEAAMERSFALTLFQAVYLALPQKIAVSALATTFILIASSNMYDLENCAHESTTEAYTTNPKNESEEEPTKAAFRHEVFDEPVIITKKVRMPMFDSSSSVVCHQRSPLSHPPRTKTRSSPSSVVPSP